MQIITMSITDVQNLIQGVVKSTIETLKSESPLFPVKLNLDQDQNFDIPAACDYLNCAKLTLQRYKKRGVFPYYQTGRTVYFKKSEIDAALANKRKGLKHAA